MSVRVVHVSTLHRALDVRIFEKECRSLARAGHEVHLVAREAPAEARDGVRFHALPAPPAAGRLGRVAARQRAAARALAALRPEVLHLHDPELIPLALVWKARGVRVVYDVHEDTPREAFTVIPGRVRPYVYAAGWWALEAVARLAFDAFVCATPDIAAHFPPARTVTVRNLPRLAELGTLSAGGAPPYVARGNRLVYVGGLTEKRGLREMIEAVGLLPEALGCRLALVGEFSPPDLADAWKGWPGAERVEARGFQSRSGVVAALSEARVGLVLLHPTPEYRVSWPVKLFEYMAAGLPVVASDFPLWRRFAGDTGAGLLVDPRDPRAIAGAIRQLLERPTEAEAMGARGARAVRERFSWEHEESALLALYARLGEG